MLAAAVVAAGVASPADAAEERGGSASSSFQTLPSGLRVLDIRDGSGPVPQRGDRVSVHWAGFTAGYRQHRIDNTSVRDEPYSFVIGDGTTIKAFEEAVMRMKKGGLCRIEVPGELMEVRGGLLSNGRRALSAYPLGCGTDGLRRLLPAAIGLPSEPRAAFRAGLADVRDWTATQGPGRLALPGLCPRQQVRNALSAICLCRQGSCDAGCVTRLKCIRPSQDVRPEPLQPHARVRHLAPRRHAVRMTQSSTLRDGEAPQVHIDVLAGLPVEFVQGGHVKLHLRDGATPVRAQARPHLGQVLPGAGLHGPGARGRVA